MPLTTIFRDLPLDRLFLDRQRELAELVCEHGLTQAKNILNSDDWLTYAAHCHFITRLLPDRSTRLIDWGGQYGQVTMMLRALGYADTHNYLLHSPARYDLVQSRFGIPTIFGYDPNRLAIADGSVDLLISSGVLEHVEDDGVGNEATVLADIHRVLKPGGWFMIWNLPTRFGSSDILARMAGRWHHRRRYRQADLVARLNAAGFTVEHLARTRFFPGSALRYFQNMVPLPTMLRLDETLARRFPGSLLARDFTVAARSRTGRALSNDDRR